jgi:hypothetical protein
MVYILHRHLVYFPAIGLFYCNWSILLQLVYFVAIWSILWPFGTFSPVLVYFVVIWYISPRFGKLRQEKSGNPDADPFSRGTQLGALPFPGTSLTESFLTEIGISRLRSEEVTHQILHSPKIS